jgi:hypothetical protein
LQENKWYKSVLGSYIALRFFIFDMPNWIHVAGKKYSANDFTDDPPTITEMFRARIEEIEKRGWNDAAVIQNSKEEFYIKCLWRIVHLEQLQRGIKGVFSYSSVVEHANEDEKSIVDILNQIKTAGYKQNIVRENAGQLNSFVAKIKSKI